MWMIGSFCKSFWKQCTRNCRHPKVVNPGNGHGKSCPPLKELWDSIANVAEKVADVAVAVWADITSGETVVYYDDLDNEVGRSTTWYLDKAVEASVNAYNDRQH